MDGGGPDRRGTRRPDPRRSPQTMHACSGPAAGGLFPGRAPPPGRPHAAREDPGPSGSGARRLGRSPPGPGQSAPAPPPRNAPPADPGRALAGPGPTVSTPSAAQGTGENPASSRRRDGPGAPRVSVGHGPAGPRDHLATAAVVSRPRASHRGARSRAQVPWHRGRPGMVSPSTACRGDYPRA